MNYSLQYNYTLILIKTVLKQIYSFRVTNGFYKKGMFYISGSLAKRIQNKINAAKEFIHYISFRKYEKSGTENIAVSLGKKLLWSFKLQNTESSANTLSTLPAYKMSTIHCKHYTNTKFLQHNLPTKKQTESSIKISKNPNAWNYIFA